MAERSVDLLGVAILLVLTALVWFVMGWVPVIVVAGPQPGSLAYGVAAAAVLLSVGMLFRLRVAYVLTLVLGLGSLPFYPIGTVFGAALVLLLFTRENRRTFWRLGL